MAHGFITGLSGSQIKPPAMPEVMTIVHCSNCGQQIDNILAEDEKWCREWPGRRSINDIFSGQQLNWTLNWVWISRRERLSKYNIPFSWTRRLVEYLADQGFDHKYGARQLQRTIERLLVTPLARCLVTHSNLRDMTIKVNLNEDNEVVLDAVL